VEFFGDGYKVAEVAKLNFTIHILKIIIAINNILDISVDVGKT